MKREVETTIIKAWNVARAIAIWTKRHPRIAVPLYVATAIGMGHAGDFVTYSDGSAAGRQGYVTKFSYKGASWKTAFIPFCKSWEGELNMSNFRGSTDGSTSNTFEFSVLNDQVKDKVIAAFNANQLVSLKYNQTYSHFSCFRDTDYIITDVVSIRNAPQDPQTPRLGAPAPRN